jgi:hypothetical protein
MLFEVLQELFIADQRFVNPLIEHSQILPVLLEGLPDRLIYQMGKRAMRVCRL